MSTSIAIYSRPLQKAIGTIWQESEQTSKHCKLPGLRVGIDCSHCTHASSPLQFETCKRRACEPDKPVRVRASREVSLEVSAARAQISELSTASVSSRGSATHAQPTAVPKAAALSQSSVTVTACAGPPAVGTPTASHWPSADCSACSSRTHWHAKHVYCMCYSQFDPSLM